MEKQEGQQRTPQNVEAQVEWKEGLQRRIPYVGEQKGQLPQLDDQVEGLQRKIPHVEEQKGQSLQQDDQVGGQQRRILQVEGLQRRILHVEEQKGQQRRTQSVKAQVVVVVASS